MRNIQRCHAIVKYILYLQHNFVGKALKGNDDSLNFGSFEMNGKSGGHCINDNFEL